mgnify:FL=1
MNTNKTFVIFYDHNTASPYQIVAKTEFSRYQDAIDYVETFLIDANSEYLTNALVVYLFSYDNQSYRYYVNGGTITKDDTTFPNTIT